MKAKKFHLYYEDEDQKKLIGEHDTLPECKNVAREFVRLLTNAPEISWDDFCDMASFFKVYEYNLNTQNADGGFELAAIANLEDIMFDKKVTDLGKNAEWKSTKPTKSAQVNYFEADEIVISKPKRSKRRDSYFDEM